MKDQSKTKQVLIQELVSLKQRISELEQVYEALRVNEQRMRLTLEGTDEGLWDLDLVTGKGKITYSDNWRKILGYGPEESRFDYEWWINQVHPESRPSFEKALLNYMSGHTKHLQYEYQIRDKSGEWKWVQTIGIFTESDKTGFPVRMSGTLRDITEHKKLEETLRDSEENYRLLFESTSDVVYSLDTELRIVGVSPSVERNLGYTPDELVGKFPHDLQILSPEDLERGLSDLLHALKGETVLPRVYRFVAKNGELIYGEISGAPIITNGKITGVICVARNITARKKAEDALRISEERLRLIAENAKVVIWMMDMNLRYTYISPYIMHNMGYTPEEYVLKSLHEVLTPSSLDLCMELFDKELKEEKNPDRDLLRSRTIEVEHIHRDGRIIWAYLQMTFIRDSAGNAVGILGITSDITERKKAEEALKLSEVTYREIFNTVNDAIWVHDIETGKFLDVNNAVTELFGYSVSEALNMNVEDISSGALHLYRRQPWSCLERLQEGSHSTSNGNASTRMATSSGPKST